MTGTRKIAFASAVAFGTLASALGAQAPKCDVDDTKPNQVKDARNAITTAGLFGKPDDRHKKLVEAVKLLTTAPEKINNNPGRSMLLGRALVMIATEPNAAAVQQKGAIGYATGAPTEMVDLLAAADTAFRVVEQSNPKCLDEVEQYRRVAYAPIVNAAVPLYNSQQVDSALVLTRRALMIYPDKPLSAVAYNILGAALITRGDTVGSIAAFQKMADVTKGDTATKNEHKDAMTRVAEFTLLRAQAANGDAKAQIAKEAVAKFDAFLAEYPDDAKAQGNRAAALQMSGDTKAVGAMFNEMLANPAKYTDMQLFEAGVGAARAENAENAAKLFEAGLQKNPYNRDGLFNLAVTLNALKAYDKMPPVLDRLLALDPNNPEAYQLYALVYQEKARKTKQDAEKAAGAAPATKTAAGKTAPAAKKPMDPATVKLYNAQNDSVLVFFKKFQDAPAKVSFSIFSHDGQKHVLGGQIENLTGDPKSYDLKVEFLDASGKVVTTGSAKLDGVASKGSKNFRIEVSGDGIAAFRYAPIA